MAAMISPQPLAVGETSKNVTELPINSCQKPSYAAHFQQKQSASKIELVHVAVVHGEPIIEFSMDEVNEFTREEGLHQAVVMKFSYGKPELQEIRKNLPAQFDIQGHCNIGQLEYRHLLVRFDLYNDYVKFVSTSAGYMKSKGEQFFFRNFSWTLDFNPKEETSMAVVWISFPGLPPNLFAKKALLSIASSVGKALAVDKATQERTRPSTARVKVLLDLLDKHPKKVKILMTDRITGKTIVHNQEVVYDNLPRYCTFCKHQGHNENSCRWKMEEYKEGDDAAETTEGKDNMEKLQGDARDFLNAKRAWQLEDVATTENFVDKLGAHIQGRKQVSNQKVEATTNIPSKNAENKAIAEVFQQDGHVLQNVADHFGEVTQAGVEAVVREALVDVGDGVPVAANGNDRDEQTVVKHMGHRVGCMSEHDLVLHVGPLKKMESTLDGQNNKIQVDLVDNFDPHSVNTCEILSTNSKVMHRDLIVGVGSTNQKRCTDLGMNVGHLGGVSVENIAGQQMFGKKGHRTVDFLTLQHETIGKGHSGDIMETGMARLEQKIGKNEGHSTVENQIMDQSTGHMDTFKNDHYGNSLSLLKNVGTISSQGTILSVENFSKLEQIRVEQKDGNNVGPTKENDNSFDVKKCNMHGNVEKQVGEIVILEQKVHVGSSKVNSDNTNGKTFQKANNIGQKQSHGSQSMIAAQLTHPNGDFSKVKNREIMEQKRDNGAGLCNVSEQQEADGIGNFYATKNETHDIVDESDSIHACTNATANPTVVQVAIRSIKPNATEAHKERQNGGDCVTTAFSIQAHSSNAPTLYFSNPNVERIIKDAQHEMMMKESIVKQPLVALNTSVYEVPSNSLESFGEYGGESGQLMISTRNNNEVREEQESARKLSYSDCKAVTPSRRSRRSTRSRKN